MGGFQYIAGYYGKVFNLGQRVRTPKGFGVVTGASNYVEVKLDGDKYSANWHPYDVEELEAAVRTVDTHHDGLGLNDSISITADELGAGNASHTYRLNIEGGQESTIVFQHGPRGEKGSTPGVTDQAVLAVLIDRMRCFQAGPYSCRENALALTKMEEALHWMRARVEERKRRGVLGTNQK